MLGGLHVARECGAGAWRRCGWTSSDWQHVLSHPLARRAEVLPHSLARRGEVVRSFSERVQVVRSFTAVVTAEAIPHLSCKLW